MASTGSSGARRGGGRAAGPLAEYRRKRDFGRTAEPSGDAEVQPARDALRFVIQKHAASHLHYDLRLELDGVMKSWAVPKGPSLDPAVRRLAMQVEDHPVSYNSFEGTIPRGEYGGGTVMLWDRGTYTPDEPKQGEAPEAAVRRGLRAGKLSFTFHGERLNGSFALVRTDRGPKPKWLLLKHRDAAADPGSDITADILTSVESGRTMDEIAAQGDRVWRSNRGGRRGGEQRTTPQAAPEPTLAPMRPTPARAIPDTGDWAFGPWRGGTRVLAWVTPEATRLIEGGGRDRTRAFRAIADDLSALAGRLGRSFVLDGEIADDDGAPTLYAGDLLLTGDEVLIERPWRERRAALEALFHRRRVSRARRQDSDSDAARVLRAAVRGGWAGIIARRVDAPYRPGEKSDAMLRIAAH
jgi:bifunctional non-homologous end joining protein LigD